MIISTEAEKGFDKVQIYNVQIWLKKKILQKVDIEGTYLNIIKAIYDKLTAHIILNGEKPKAFPLRSGTWQRCPLSPLLFNIVLEVLATKSNKKNNYKKSNSKGRNKTVSVCRCLIWHIENPKDVPNKLLEHINEFGKTAGYKIKK